MLNWIAGFVDRWSGIVAQGIRDLIHWTVHALASVVYTVFGLVGSAWRDVYKATDWLLVSATGFLYETYKHVYRIIVYWIPRILRLIDDWVKWLIRRIEQVTAYLLSRILYYYRLLRTALDIAVRWIVHTLIDPLRAFADHIWKQLIAWGYYAFYYITHPDKLAAVLIRALVGAAENVFWDIAAPVGKFAAGIVLHNAKRIVLVIESILSAVL